MRWAPIAPMPTDQAKCRWCDGPLRALVDGQAPTYCSYGCARNDRAPYLGYCENCLREFETGKLSAVLCAECDAEDHAAHVTAFAPLPASRYIFSRFGHGRDDV